MSDADRIMKNAVDTFAYCFVKSMEACGERHLYVLKKGGVHLLFHSRITKNGY